MRRCVIVGAADIGDPEKIRGYFKCSDRFIFCDGGIRHMDSLRVSPYLFVGDFDSYVLPQTETETIILPREKDDTDTVFATKEALRRGFDEFLFVGVMGGRPDHSFANISLMLMLDSLGKYSMIAGDGFEMEIVSRRVAYVEDGAKYFSLLPICEEAEGVSIKGAKYPLKEEKICCEYPFAVSNEVLEGQRAEISVKKGRLCLIKIFSE
ncbi:MAG: thiamine diphosphokinase [Ruminococcaceae bacterium]|nr:thiamine diphosphokinase [Oscillospiraceae bacterium]